MKLKYLILSILIGASNYANAIGLQEALALAYKNSDQLKASREVFLQEIEQMSAAISRFLPDIVAQISVDDTKSTNTSTLAPKGSRRVADTNLTIAMQQNIFNGGSDIAALKAAQSAYRASRAKLYDSEQKMFMDAIEDYMSFYQAQETYKIMEVAVEFNSKQLAMVNERFKLGEATRTDIAQASAAYSKAESQKLVALSNLESSKAKFLKTFGTEPENVSLPNSPSGLPDSLDKLISKAMSNNFTIQQVKNNLASAKAIALSAKGNLLPNVDFKAQLGNKYYNPEVMDPAQMQSYTNSRTFTTSLSVTIPIYSRGGAEYSNIRKANSEARKNAHQMDDVLSSVKTSAIGSWTGYNAAKAAIVSADQAVEAYTLVLEGVGFEYNVGSKSILDVLKAQQDLEDINIQNIKTKKDCITSAYQMKALTGDMTAVSLKLPVKYFNPGTEFRKVKAKIIGF